MSCHGFSNGVTFALLHRLAVDDPIPGQDGDLCARSRRRSSGVTSASNRSSTKRAAVGGSESGAPATSRATLYAPVVAPPSEVAKLIAGPNVFICDACVSAAERTLN